VKFGGHLEFLYFFKFLALNIHPTSFLMLFYRHQLKFQSYTDYYSRYGQFQFSERPFLKYRPKHWKSIIKIGNMIFLFPYRLTYDFSILAKNPREPQSAA